MSERINWKDTFTNKLSANGFNQEDIALIYITEMECKAFFEFDGVVPNCLRLQNIERAVNEMIYFWESISFDGTCPNCGAISAEATGDYYEKRIQDIPYGEMAVYHLVRLKRYLCRNKLCVQGRFVERFFEFTEEKARKTLRFKKYCVERSLGCGCHRAEFEIRSEGGVVSNDSIGRYLKNRAADIIESNVTQDQVRVLSLDDFNLRKGDRSTGCTIFIDEEKHKVLIIVKGTTKEAAKSVMEMFPSATIISRDRASGYASAGTALGKIQIADRFHLVQNAHAVVESVLKAEIPAMIFIRQGEGWETLTSSVYSDVSAQSIAPQQTIADRIKLAGLTPAKAKKYEDTLKMLELSFKGLRTDEIAITMSISPKDVYALRKTAVSTVSDVEEKINKRMSEIASGDNSSLELPGAHAVKTVGGLRVNPATRSIVEPYRETVVEMWKAGGNHRTIYPVIQAQGYTGSKNAIYQYILKIGKESPNEIARDHKLKKRDEWMEDFDIDIAKSRPELALESAARGSVYNAVLKEASMKRDNTKDDEFAGKPIGKKPTRSSFSSSPYSEKVYNLIYGKDEDVVPEKKTAKAKKKLD